MNTSNFIVRIPEPCHEDWNKMQPDAKGKFCNSCNKAVFDFSTKTDAEIKDILLEYKDQKVCGHFKKSQINRPLNIKINLRDIPVNISITKVFAISLFLVFGTFLFSCTDNHGQKVNGIEVVDDNQKEIVLGDISIDPPLVEMVEQHMTMTGDIMFSMDTVETFSSEEIHVDGGISFEEIPAENVPIMDSVYLEEVTVVDYLEPLIDSDMTSGTVTMGLIAYVIEPDTIVENTSDSIIIDNTIKTAETPLINDEFNIYPNPSNGEFTIKYIVRKRANVLLEIYDMKGILIKPVVDISNQYEGNYQIPVNLNELPNGIYLVNLIIGDKKTVERVVIER